MKKLLIILSVIMLLSFLMVSFVSGNDSENIEQMADQLKEIGLFLGTENGYELDRTPTRAEACVMLVRLLGKESAAKRGRWVTPFTDVPEWAEKYVGYAYKYNLTKGISDTEFGTDEPINAAQFLTFVLRALGYKDSEGDFVWNEADKLAVEIGIIESGRYNNIEQDKFLRADTVLISYNSLNTMQKEKDVTLITSLANEGAVDTSTALKLGFQLIKPKYDVNGRTNIYVSDFGAIGDGITDDGVAVRKAVRKASSSKTPCNVVFDEGKTYYCNQILTSGNSTGVIETSALLYLDDANDVVLCGNGARLELGVGITASYIKASSNITIQDLTIDYRIQPFVSGSVIKYDNAKMRFQIETDQSMHLEDGVFETTSSTYFALPNLRDTKRNFLTITKYEEIDATHYWVYPANYSFAISQISTYGSNTPWIWPAGESAHLTGPINSINDSGNITYQNVRYEASRAFLFNLRSNVGEIHFYNVDLQPSQDCDIQYMVSWRDVFHIKDGRAPVILEDCDIGWAGDDFINISCTSCYITEIDGNNIVLKTTEFNSAPNWMEGDLIEAYNSRTGKYYGTATIVAVDSKTGIFTLDKKIPGLEVSDDVRVDSPNAASPGSKITNCTFAGTGRFKGEVEVNNCYFDLLALWLETEISYEGPIPKKIVFNNCTFENGGIEIGAFNRAVPGSSFPEVGKKIDITFNQCTFINCKKIITDSTAPVFND